MGGDRSDSLGHSAKIGSYTVIELQNHLVIDVCWCLWVHVTTSPVLYNAVHVYLFRVTKKMKAIIWRKKDLSEQFSFLTSKGLILEHF